MLNRPAPLLSLAIVVLLLAACGLSDSPRGLKANLEPTNLGFEVDSSGRITVVANNVTFMNSPGASPVVITGYRVRFLTDDEGDSPLINYQETDLYSDHLAIPVPPGYRCPDEDRTDCDMWERIPVSAQSEPSSFILLPHTIAEYILMNDVTRVRTAITFRAEQGRTEWEWTQEVTATMPVGTQ